MISHTQDHVKGLQEQREQLNKEIRAKTTRQVASEDEEIYELVRLVPLQEQILVVNLQWVLSALPQGRCRCVVRRRTRIPLLLLEHSHTKHARERKLHQLDKASTSTFLECHVPRLRPTRQRQETKPRARTEVCVQFHHACAFIPTGR